MSKHFVGCCFWLVCHVLVSELYILVIAVYWWEKLFLVGSLYITYVLVSVFVKLSSRL